MWWTYLNEVDEVVVIFALQLAANRVGAFAAAARNAAVLGADQAPVPVEKVRALICLVYHLLGRHADPNYEVLQEFALVHRWE